MFCTAVREFEKGVRMVIPLCPFLRKSITMCMYIYIYIYLHIYICVCVFIYVYEYIYTSQCDIVVFISILPLKPESLGSQVHVGLNSGMAFQVRVRLALESVICSWLETRQHVVVVRKYP